MYRIISLTVILMGCLKLFGAYFENLATEQTLPDGSKLSCFASGDEFYNRLHDRDGYTIVQNSLDGCYYYAEKKDGKLQPSTHKFINNSANRSGLPQYLKDDPEYYLFRSEGFNLKQLGSPKLHTKGLLNNLVVLVRFSDMNEFTEPRQVLEDRFNAQDGQESVFSYFKEISYNQLLITSSLFPVCENGSNLSVQIPHPRSYYLPYDPLTNPAGYLGDQGTERETEMLTYALNQIKDQVPAALDLDANNDGYIDNVSFVVRGPHAAWSQLLWAHRSWFNGDLQINGKMVANYTLQPENQNTVPTICHELFHTMGAPDLYHNNFDGLTPVGCWDIMESGFVHTGAYMKYKYGGWISSLPEITVSGQYSLQPLNTATGNCYKIPIAGSSDFLLLEYRRQTSAGYEKNLPASGLLVYRINSQAAGNGDGPPDEIYIYREKGTAAVNGRIIEAAMSRERGRTSINQYTDPALFLSAGGMSSVNIYDIGTASDSITFKIDLNGQNIQPTISFAGIENGDFVQNNARIFKVNTTAYHGAVISRVDFYLDDQPVESDNTLPYELYNDNSQLDAGRHILKAVALDSEGRSSERVIQFTVFNPQTASWFDYTSDNPLAVEYNRGCLPLLFATDFNLGNTDYLIKKIYLNIAADPFGQPEVPGLFKCQVVRMENGAISSNVLVDLGSFVSPLNGRFEAQISDPSVIHGQIALVMDIGSYHKLVFDQRGLGGHAWVSEPDRLWTDALARGFSGAPQMGMQLVQKDVSIAQAAEAMTGLLIRNYPNPFNNSTILEYQLALEGQVRLTIYNARGETVKTLVDQVQKKGQHCVNFSAAGLNSGLYFYQLETAGRIVTNKMLLLK